MRWTTSWEKPMIKQCVSIVKKITLLSVLFACTSVIAPAENAQAAGKVFSVCIGDVCPQGVAGAANYNYECGFAQSHASDTDEAAAKFVCQLVNDYDHYFFSRYYSGSGGACGRINILVRCK
jgi:hypothetical protein